MHRQALVLYETVLRSDHRDRLTSAYCIVHLLHREPSLRGDNPLRKSTARIPKYVKTRTSYHEHLLASLLVLRDVEENGFYDESTIFTQTA
jgi:hypothetical protein